MNKDKYLRYAVAAVAGVGIALWAGVPPFFLLILGCPVMMFFMMGSMMGGQGSNHGDAHGHGVNPPPTTRTPDGSHDRIDQP
ncbi:MAG: DUF2933 domain-containing protein [Marmoricola sp.]